MGEVRSLKTLELTLLLVVSVDEDATGVAVPPVPLMRCTRSSESRSSASVCCLKGSRLERIVPEKRTGS